MAVKMNGKTLRLEHEPPGPCDFDATEMKAAIRRFEDSRGIKRRPFVNPLPPKKENQP
jgi:hypothetical protein